MIRYMSMLGVSLFFYCNPGGHFCRRGPECIIFEEDSNCQYSHPPFFAGATFQDLQRMPETIDSTEHYIYCFFLGIPTYDKV